ncbi:MAG: bifunctional riboflavin kinase/FAD synthetase [Phaeodactylibacter sp.]|uniref:bifunctional riboflavin kinase/FAD synthetase n=1 Tax=Phaeodactylibacter sp. TaxID=1940289 RepID=UPI0032EAF5B0
MRVLNDLNALPDFQNAVVTIGSFDGVHLGHQQILDRVKRLARQSDGESIVITFHPHPRLVIYPKDQSLQLITSIDEKVDLMRRYGIDNVVVVPFTVAFSQQSADEYIQKFLVEKFHPRYIVIGYDHRFGLNRQGDINYLKWHGEQSGYEVEEIGKHEVEDIAVSSTKIRRALETGAVDQAYRLLGHYFFLTGTVVHGNKIGKKLGFPTANLDLGNRHKLLPPAGIYAVYAYHKEQRYGGMLYIGDRPTLKEYQNKTIEVNLFDFDKDIYGDKLRLELVARTRDDQAFEDLEQLSMQLAQDRKETQAIIKSLEGSVEAKAAEPPRVAIVILNYNGRGYLERFLPKVLEHTDGRFEVVIADNGSTDDSLAFLAAAYPHLRHIDLKINYGFAEGYNQALEQVDAPYFLLLNSDVEVTPGWLDALVELMERDPSVGAVQPKILAYHEREKFEYAGAAGGWLDNLGYPFCRGRIFSVTETDRGQYDELQEVFWATGAAFLVRSSLFKQLGGFDGDYFAHSEEIDLCWRIKRAGYKIMARPRSVVYHVGGGTLSYNTPRKAFLNFRNSLFTLVKNETTSRLAWILPARLVLDGVAALLFLSQGKFQHIGAIVRAHWSFFGQWKKTWQKRRANQDRVAKVSIAPEPNLAGRYKKSIVWAFYAKNRHYFKDL